MTKLDRFFMNTAKEAAILSNCVSYKVGAVIVKDGRIISTGYNGTPSGFYKNCNEIFKNYDKTTQREEHHDFSLTYEIHAEMNAILFAARNGISIENTIMYVTVKPCAQCIKNIVQSGVRKVIYLNEYDKEEVKDNKITGYGLLQIEKYTETI